MGKSALAVTAFLVCSTFQDVAWAERIDANHTHAANVLALDVALDALQFAVIGAADSDWYETPGADVWRVTLDHLELQVKVLPTKAQGKPSNCCFSFAVGDTSFWIHAKGALAEPNNSRNPLSPVATINAGTQLSVGQSGASDYGVDRTSPAGAFDPLESTSIHVPRVSSAESPALTDVSVAQLPEPALGLMFGIAVTAAARRVKARC